MASNLGVVFGVALVVLVLAMLAWGLFTRKGSGINARSSDEGVEEAATSGGAAMGEGRGGTE